MITSRRIEVTLKKEIKDKKKETNTTMIHALLLLQVKVNEINHAGNSVRSYAEHTIE